MSRCFSPATICLPDFSKQTVDPRRWSCVACDQYTSEVDYWTSLDAEVGAYPSTLRLILPEVWLGEADARIPAIHDTMNQYASDIMLRYPNRMIYVERTLNDGSVRKGLVGKIDLCAYEYQVGASSLIRATEKTVTERIPPRMAIRRGAALELPHVMLLIDDPADSVIGTASRRAAELETAYDYPLMAKGGHLHGAWLDDRAMDDVTTALDALITPEAMADRYGSSNLAPLLFAVGDGNHSLASAKAYFEEIKAEIGEEAAMSHPARYALVEVVNLYDESLQFEPIYRVLFGVDPAAALKAWEAYAAAQNGSQEAQTVDWYIGDTHGQTAVPHPTSALAVGTVQAFLDDYLKTAPDGAYIDYIHGEETAVSLAKEEGAIAFLYDGMKKEQLFFSVIADGSLPRKTFSMGHAHDKRFYTEARELIRD